jgi:hypothetical protein
MIRSSPPDLQDLKNEPQFELKTLPGDLSEFLNERYQRPRALAHVRKQWERECQEVLALPPEKLAVKSIETPKNGRNSGVDSYEELRVVKEADFGGPF